MKPSLDVIVVNWNSGRQLRACLESLVARRSEHHILNRVVVLDNASIDGSASTLDDLALPLQVVRNGRNLGFGAACNRGAAGSCADALLFLNPDARVFVETIDEAVRFLFSRSRTGICGVALLDDRGAVGRTCARLPSARDVVIKALGIDRLSRGLVRSYLMEEWPHDETRRVDHVIGAFYLVRREVYEELSGFDERFFVYLEDLDFSARAAAAGWESWFLSSARAYHKGGGTSGRVRATRLAYSLRSRLQYSAKHFGLLGHSAVWLATLLAEPMIRVGVAAVRGSTTELRETWSGYARLYRALIT